MVGCGGSESSEDPAPDILDDFSSEDIQSTELPQTDIAEETGIEDGVEVGPETNGQTVLIVDFDMRV